MKVSSLAYLIIQEGQIMVLSRLFKHKRKKDQTFFFDGQKVSKLQNYGLGFLMENQEGDWDRLTSFLMDNSIDVYCTFNAFDRFVNNTLATGHVQDFINYVAGFVKKYPANMYNLLMDGTLTLVEVEN